MRAGAIALSAKRLMKRVKAAWHPIGVANFSGSLWDRLRGLDYLYDHCAGSSILDVGSCEGLVSYEFARRGAFLIHGLERDRHRVVFCRRLFRDVPVQSCFQVTNLAAPRSRFMKSLLPQYDIVLFLGIYQHLKLQMDRQDLLDLVSEFCGRCRRFFVVRTGRIPEFEPVIFSAGFRLVHSDFPERPDSGALLRIYERN